MKLSTFIGHHKRPRLGVVDLEQRAVLDLATAAETVHRRTDPNLVDMLSLIDAAAPGLARVEDLVREWPSEAAEDLDGVKLLAPVPIPRQLRDGMAFEEHVYNSRKQVEKRTGRPQKMPEVWYEHPVYYKCNRFNVVGHEADVIWPSYSEWMDYELEIACVIGKTGKDIFAETAPAHVFGFTIYDDFSARDAQFTEMRAGLGPAKGKDFDTGNVFGPWIVTPDELGDPHDLTMEVRVNGERWGGGSTKSMHYTFWDIIAWVSKDETLYAGEIIGSGTVGTGSAHELGKTLAPNDVIELEIEKIGVLRNRLIRPHA
ncbi:putative 2-hydroxyhepta-2,4-diene-1,7-dioate isomerase [Rhodovulum sp. PH10]|uniref:fumarylacetoacetate hydrolase family protein n=1 Tax=Rhodovulum sp. PH10 TaxID=1187851 RepID=UPI00027C29B3|nr:fumarylacetoacetate hydrolase family protein [Rhodovulum sp. PH10]EJW13303.1 putative 2-hydroxyhepta-2,4-diene-1,7-dioate isomerase [Rhodovulum sp. PH10]